MEPVILYLLVGLVVLLLDKVRVPSRWPRMAPMLSYKYHMLFVVLWPYAIAKTWK